MEETYCIKDERVTACVQPSGFQSDKNEENNFIVIVLFVE